MITRSMNAVFSHGTVSSNAVSLATFVGTHTFTSAEINAADHVIISVESGVLRVTWDAAQTVPLTSSGMKIPANNWPWADIIGTINAGHLQMIRDSTTDAVINIMLEMG